MLSSDHNLRHLPFFEEIAAHEETDAEWQAATAGLMVLRLVDAWMEEGAHVVRADGWTLRNVQALVAEVEQRDNLRSILANIVDVMAESSMPGMQLLAPRLMAYGQLLEYDAAWHKAADVYDTIIAHTHPGDEADAATHAHLRRGFCLRQVGLLTDSVQAYQAAEQIAEAADDMEGVLRARIGEAKTNALHGNLPRAEAILDATIGRAAELQLSAIRSMALHDRATVAGGRGDYELAIKLAYEALESSPSRRDRDRILGDIATAFQHLGVRSAARDAFLILAATAQEQYVRWAATLNLMDVAAEEGDEFQFEYHRRRIDVAVLPPALAVQYWLDGGRALGRFGQLDEARTFLNRAIALAEEHSLNQSIFEAEQAMSGLGKTRPSPKVAAAIEDEEVERIARKVAAARGAATSLA